MIRAAAAAAALALSALSLAGPAAGQGAETSETVTVTATVQTVDQETRQVLLRDDATGEIFVIVAGPEVVNLPQLEAGDVVAATYLRAAAARMALPGEEGTAVAVAGGAAEEGDKPGAMMGESVSTVVTFVSWDAATNVATATDDAGATREIAVRSPEMQAFAAGLSAGDRVEVTLTEAMAIGVVER